MLKVSMLLFEYGKIAYFQIQLYQAFSPWLFVKELGCIHGLLVLKTCHWACYIALRASPVQDGIRGKKEKKKKGTLHQT